MKSVVMVAYGFPPEGHAGIYRPVRFVRSLPAFGWQPIVVTRESAYYERYDRRLLELVPSDTRVVRVRNPDPWQAIQARRSKRAEELRTAATGGAKPLRDAENRWLRSLARSGVRKLESMIYRPDPAMLWIRPATRAGVEASRQAEAQVVWGTGGPWSSMIVARNISRRTGLPYVLDFRDSWTLTHSEFEHRQPEWIRARDRRLLADLFRNAQAVVLRYRSEAEAYWQAYPGALDPGKVHLIPNGFEGAVVPTDVPRGDRCSLIYTGIVTDYWYEGLMEAVRLLHESDPETASRLRLLFVGEGTEAVGRLAHDLGVSDIVDVSGVVSSARAERLQRESHALLLLGWKPGVTRGHELGGSKIFSYLKAGRPIVGVLPDDENSRILRSVRVSSIAPAGSPPEIMRLLQRVLRSWMTGELASMLPDRDACQMYSSKTQTQALVRALEGRTCEDPFVPGTCNPPPSLEKWLRGLARMTESGGRRSVVVSD